MSTERKLHQIVAIWKGRKRRAEKIIEEAIVTFSKRTDHFRGHVKRYVPIEEEMSVAGFNEFPPETKALDTTVDDKLQYVFESATEYLDTLMELESTNQAARADIWFKGQTIAEEVPITMLLNLESILTDWRKMFIAIPTLPPGEIWDRDLDHEKAHVYKARFDNETIRYEKKIVPIILWEGGENSKHAPQIEKVNKNIPVGKFVTSSWCGMITPAEKSAMLDNLDKLIESVQDAKQRAKATEVISKPIGERLVKAILEI